MASSKTVAEAATPKVADDSVKEPEAKKEAQPPGQNAQAPGSPGAPAAPATRRPNPAKEVIPFAWKLVGESNRSIVTLFKAVEREEVEAHYHRLIKDGYYKQLRVLTLDTVIKQPKPPPKKKTAKPAVAKKKAAKKSPAKAKAAPKKSSPSEATKTKKASPAKKAVPAKKTAKAKPKTAKKTAKATAKKKKK